MLLTFAIQTYCILYNCFPTYPPVKVVEGDNDGSDLGIRIGRDNTELVKLDTTSPPIAFTRSGWVQGYFQKTILGRSIAAFQGIPFAQPPLGRLRFREPLPNYPWRGTYQAIKSPPACLQLDFTQFLRIHGQEDCLYLNVYTPVLPSLEIRRNNTDTKQLPVIFYIHGGAYLFGTSSNHGAAYLLNRDIVLVTINYRLGILGYLSTGDEHASGNWGLKDQLLALKWVAANIKYFGGDSNRITIMGDSAGAVSVGLHVVSNQSAGLFHGAISESGSALSYWGLLNNTVENSKTISNLSGCPINNSKNMLSCLREKDANWMVASTVQVWEPDPILLFRGIFGPTIEPKSPTAFLDEAPEVAYINGNVNRVPMIVGWNRDEGAVFSAMIYLFPANFRRFNKDWKHMIPYCFMFENRTNNVVEMAEKIRNFYMNGEPMSWNNRRQWIQMFGDRIVMQGVHTTMQYHSSVAPTYGYMFSYEGSTSVLGLSGLRLRNKEWGISHSDELIYLFNSTTHFIPLTVGTKDYDFSERFINLWTTFAATGRPFYEDHDEGIVDIWKPISGPDDVQILDIDEKPSFIQFPSDAMQRIKFWQKLRLRDDHDFPVTFM